jgi:membrane fusion protein (multidrug efflux system)
MSSTPTATLPTAGKPKRNRLLILIGLGILVLGILYALYYFLIGIHYESTDDAYVAGNVVQITPLISGTVVGIKADDTNYVKAGQEILDLDKADGQVALEQAEAQLAQTVREVRTLYANNGTLTANIAARDADVVKARAELDRAESDIKRRQALVATGAVAKRCSTSSPRLPMRRAPTAPPKQLRRRHANSSTPIRR